MIRYIATAQLQRIGEVRPQPRSSFFGGFRGLKTNPLNSEWGESSGFVEKAISRAMKEFSAFIGQLFDMLRQCLSRVVMH